MSAVLDSLPSPDVRFAEVEQGWICEGCGKLCDVYVATEFETSEARGAVETREVSFYVSECCNEGCEPTQDKPYGERC